MSEKVGNPNLGESSVNTLARLFLAGIAIVGVFGDSYMDIAGDLPREVPKPRATKEAQEQYAQAFAQLSPADKFSVQYGGITKIYVDTEEGGNGILGSLSVSENYIVSINNGCLGNTAYDVNGGNIDLDVSGLFTRVSLRSNIPTAAAFVQRDETNPDVIHVNSGNSNSVNLNFSGVTSGKELTPLDEDTERILETYGCETGLISIRNEYK